jgi:hypothetical protein
MKIAVMSLFLAAALAGFASSAAHADDAAPPPAMTKHQMMKDCMAKQRASDGGVPKEDMKKACKDVTATERENDKAEKKAEAAEKAEEGQRP